MTRKYIDTLYALEEGLYNEQQIMSFDIRRDDRDKSLRIMMRLKEMIGVDAIGGLLSQAKLLGEMAVNVQKFGAARIVVCDKFDKPVLEEIVIA